MSTTDASTAAPVNLRNWIKADGSTEFAPEVGRYHLYVAHMCPFAHRALLARTLNNLDDVIGLTVIESVMPDMEIGLAFDPASPDPVFPEYKRLRELYLRNDPNFVGRPTVPLLFDLKTRRIVNNESPDIVRMLSTEFRALRKPHIELFPLGDAPEAAALRARIEDTNATLVSELNSGIYKVGFAPDQAAYDAASDALFATLDRLDALLAAQRFVNGAALTESDIFLAVTLVRFDIAYAVQFLLTRKRIVDYPNIWAYIRDIYQLPRVAATVVFEDIKRGLFLGARYRHPRGLIPNSPSSDWNAPSGRERL